MSYILDALKKADAERRKEQVPGIHTQPLATASRAAEPSPRHRTVMWAAIATAAAAAGAAAMYWPRPEAPSAPPAVRTPPPIAQSPMPMAQAPVQTTPAGPQAAAQSPRPQGATQARPLGSPPPFQQRQSLEQNAPKEARKERAAAPAPEARSEARPDVRPEVRVPTLRELPDAIQRELPEMKIGGYILGDNPADRSVLINNRLVHEGEEASPGVVLERMQKNGMILRFREFRFIKPY
jgi:general secretion pathway protein B